MKLWNVTPTQISNLVEDLVVDWQRPARMRSQALLAPTLQQRNTASRSVPRSPPASRMRARSGGRRGSVSYTHLRAHETGAYL
eukprot:6439108-Pyramimonas_sp.AAC.1